MKYHIRFYRTVPPGGMKVYGADYLTNASTVCRKSRRTLKANSYQEAVAKLESETRRKYSDDSTIKIYKAWSLQDGEWVELNLDTDDNAEDEISEWAQAHSELALSNLDWSVLGY